MQRMKLSRIWTFVSFSLLIAVSCVAAAKAQTVEPAPSPISSHYFTKTLLNDEEWNDLKLFPSINPKSRPETDPTRTPNDAYFKLPWYLQKFQVAQLIAGLIQYRVFGIFHHQPMYYAKKYKLWSKKQSAKFNFLKLHMDRYQPKIENGLTFINSKYEYRGISDKAIGYCYGVSTVLKKFTHLAFFSETVSPEDQVPEKESDEWYSYYIHKMHEVLKGEAVFFPGFKNLRELTTVPEFEFYLKVQVTKQWKKMATLKSTLRSYIGNTKEMTTEEVNELVEDLKARLNRGEFPKIIFASAISKTFLTGGARTHVVLTTKVEELPEEKITRIHVWDINFYAEDLVQRPYYIEIKTREDGTPELRYHEWANPSHDTKNSLLRTEIPGDRLGQVLVAGENNREVVDTIESIEEFCANPPAGHPEIAAECARAKSE